MEPSEEDHQQDLWDCWAFLSQTPNRQRIYAFQAIAGSKLYSNSIRKKKKAKHFDL